MVLLLVLSQLTPTVREGGLTVGLEDLSADRDRVALIRLKVDDLKPGSVRVPLELGDRVATGTTLVVEGLPRTWLVEVRRVTWTLADAVDPSTEADHAVVAVTQTRWISLRHRPGGTQLPVLPPPAPPSRRALRRALEPRGPRFTAALDAGVPATWVHESAWEVRLIRVDGSVRDVVKQVVFENPFGC